jgi:hypothetical protein
MRGGSGRALVRHLLAALRRTSINSLPRERRRPGAAAPGAGRAPGRGGDRKLVAA